MSNPPSSRGAAQQSPPVAHLLAGACGGLATAILTCPLDVLRTRLQSDMYAQARFEQRGNALQIRPHRMMHVINAMYHKEGWRSFYRGLGPSMAGVVPASAIKFYVYGNFKRFGANALGCEEDDTIVHAQAAVLAGVATATMTNPIWVIKTRLQLDRVSTDKSRQRYRDSLDCVRQILKLEGAKGLLRGLSASYLGTAETALHLVLYERLKTLYGRSLRCVNVPIPCELSEWISTSGAAGSAKLAAGLIAYPHEVVRTRLRQAAPSCGIATYTGLWQCFGSIARHEGLKGLYGGLTPHLARSIPSAMITLGVYESFLRLSSS